MANITPNIEFDIDLLLVLQIDIRRELVWGDEMASGFTGKFIQLCLETEGIFEEGKSRGIIYTLTVKHSISLSLTPWVWGTGESPGEHQK